MYIDEKPAPLKDVCRAAVLMTWEDFTRLANAIEYARSTGAESKRRVSSDILAEALVSFLLPAQEKSND